MRRRGIGDWVDLVTDNDLCTGCGACCQLDPGLTMSTDDDGFARPVRTGTTPESQDPAVARRFRRTCPGLTLDLTRRRGVRHDRVVGQYLAAWEAWATDPEIRHRGSSGGTLTALTAWLTESGREVVAAGADPTSPTRTVPVQITSRREALAAAGSRYGPVGVGAHPSFLSADVAVAKPCEIAAHHALTDGEGGPLRLSFFCAGTPSQHATDALVEHLNPTRRRVAEMWYRGRGWPGRFSVVTDVGTSEMDYDDSWGKHLGPATQWRCKLCPDGVGEFSDVSAGDYWESDDRGYPVFTEQAGRSALVARTPRGVRLVEDALRAGVIAGRPLEVTRIAAVQPYQRRRREVLLGRLVGTRLAGRRTPRYRGFGLATLAWRHPRATWAALRGARGRVRRARRGG